MIAASLALLLCTQPPTSPIPADARQLVVVTAADWSSTSGTVALVERSDAGERVARVWASPTVSVEVGKRGLGRARQSLAGASWSAGPEKKEGDLRAPAGVFALGAAFGEEDVTGLKVPFLRMSAPFVCVDDTKSGQYDRVVDETSVVKDWTSAERMKRADVLYRLGVVIDANPRHEPGAGSCVFLHVRRGPGKSTAGCTAFEEGALRALLGWLDSGARPVLVQLPRAVFKESAELSRLLGAIDAAAP